MDYTLKDKIQITKEFLNDLEARSWQEIEHLQNQIANIEASENNLKVIQLLKHLLTSYYVFAGGLENLEDVQITSDESIIEPDFEQESEDVPVESKVDYEDTFNDDFEPLVIEKPTAPEEPIEPFEYFVDFDDPIGDPMSDEDLYGK